MTQATQSTKAKDSRLIFLLSWSKCVTNQERIKPHTERAADDQSKVDELRGSPMSVGNLEEIIDDKYAPARVRPSPHVEPAPT